MSDEDLSVDSTRSLLRLYLGWTDNIAENPEAEANAFYGWMVKELGQEEVDEIILGLDDVKHFLARHAAVLDRARYLKGKPIAVVTNERDTVRVDINTQVFFLVYDCAKEPALDGRIVRGILLDMARAGMRLETGLAIPIGSILSITVAQAGQEVTLYHLTGEVRWCNEGTDAIQMGVSIFNIEDHREWQFFYDANVRQEE